MRLRLAHLLGTCALVLLVSGCSSNDEDDEDLPFFGGVRALNAFPETELVTFRVVFQDFDPSVLTQLAYQVPSPLVGFSEREYTFTFEINLPDEEEPRVLFETVGTVLPDLIYDYVLAGTLDDPQFLLWTQPRRDWVQVLIDAENNGTTITELDVAFGHAAFGEQAVDVFLEPPGTDLATATPSATMAFGELAPPLTIEEATLQITLTAQGDPGTVLFTSEEIDFLAANTAVYVLLNDAGRSTQSINLQQLVESTAVSLFDINAPGAISVIHAAPEAAAIDVYDNTDFDTPLVSGLSFGELSDDAALDAGDITIATTPAGDVGVVLSEVEVELPAGAYRRIYVAAQAGDVQSFAVNDDRRVFATQGRLRAFNGASQFESVDLFLLQDDQELETAPRAISFLAFGGASPLATIDPGTYDLIVTENDTTNILFGPTELVVEGGNVFELVITDDAQMTQADVTILETASP